MVLKLKPVKDWARLEPNRQKKHLIAANLSTQCLIFSALQLTVPLMETMTVPVSEPNSSPADIVNGIAGIART